MQYIRFVLVILLLAAGATSVYSQEFQALARIDPSKSEISERTSGDIDVTLKLTQAVPFRVFTLADPTRLILDFREVNWSGLDDSALVHAEAVLGVRYGLFRPGWSRMVLELASPMAVHTAEMKTDPNDGDAVLEIRLTEVPTEQFLTSVGSLSDGFWSLPDPVVFGEVKTRQTGTRPVIVVLDPGHGGLDPGAQYGGFDEAELMLLFARELKDKLIKTGRYEVFLTRSEDQFLSLEERVGIARQLGADVFMSLHADALQSGSATGSTVYTLSAGASDEASAELAQSLDRAELLAGVDLSKQDDQVATVLMDMARIETEPRATRLARELVDGIAKAVGRIRRRPHLSAGFTVLKAPDIPSVLLELGFMSNSLDLSNLTTEKWRNQVADGILTALDVWTIADAAEAKLLRQ